ncbi:MAG: polymer-forming cytoskeletal protein [Actinomycetota bacterium]
MIRRGCVILGAVVAVAWPGDALAQTGQAQPADQVVLSGDVNVARGTVVGEVVVFSGSATIDGVAAGDVVVLDGTVTIGGQVGGDVIAFNGPIRLLSTAQVTGDVLAGGNLIAAEGSQVHGEIRRDVGFTMAGPVAVLGALLVSIALAVSILLAGLLVLLLAPRGAERTAEAAQDAPWATAGWGALLAVGVPIVAVAAAATIVGLPLGLAVLLGLGLVGLVGQAAVTFVIGRLVVRAPRSRFAALFAGWGIGAAIGLVPFLNVVWWSLGAVFGVGAIVVAAWRSRRGWRAEVGSSTERFADVPLAED